MLRVQAALSNEWRVRLEARPIMPDGICNPVRNILCHVGCCDFAQNISGGVAKCILLSIHCNLSHKMCRRRGFPKTSFRTDIIGGWWVSQARPIFMELLAPTDAVRGWQPCAPMFALFLIHGMRIHAWISTLKISFTNNQTHFAVIYACIANQYAWFLANGIWIAIKYAWFVANGI